MTMILKLRIVHQGMWRIGPNYHVSGAWISSAWVTNSSKKFDATHCPADAPAWQVR